MSDTSLFILTSASHGLGTALAQALMQSSHRLICVAHGDNVELYMQAATAGVTFDWHQVDLSDTHAAEAWVTRTLTVLSAFAKATLVLNADAAGPTDTVDTLRADTLLPHLQLNLAGPMALTAVPPRDTAPWNTQRRVLTISLGATRRPIAGWVAYCTGRVGLDVFVRAIDADGGANVRAVAFTPGVVDTDMQRTIRGTNFTDVQRFRDLHARGELVSPQGATTHIATYLVRPDFGATELDDLHNIA